MNNLILVAGAKPPSTYLRALNLVGLNYKAHPFPNDLSPFTGLLLTGGGDVFPPFYGGKTDFFNENLIRDSLEFQLIDHFFSKNLPILGICRGLQILNVFFGGTLKTVVGHENQGKDITHPVIPPKNGFLKGFKLVNSNHLQCVDKLCEHAENICYATDDTVEGFTVGDNILAVQFHPERMDLHSTVKVYGSFARLVENHK
ncbi:MAG: gamma-glutamyl-gamma-aminobutyrate hydrolase family protein [Clostridia bacterium]|nr:gamma-glutamyl-gamma-aminobutyrate hydrolase family protein [Clostridia bacterium]